MFKDLGIVFFVSLLEFLIFKNSDKALIATHMPVNLSLSLSLMQVYILTSLYQSWHSYQILLRTQVSRVEEYFHHVLLLLDTLVQDQHPNPVLLQYNSHSAQLAKKSLFKQ